MQRILITTLLFLTAFIDCKAKSLGSIGNQHDTITTCSSGFLLMGGSKSRLLAVRKQF